MSRPQSGPKAMLAALKSMVEGAQSVGDALIAGKKHRGRKQRTMATAMQAEACEPRLLLTRLNVTSNVNVSQLAGNQTNPAIAVNPSNPQQLFAVSENQAGGLFASYSIDGGATWLPSNGSDKVIADGSDSLVTPAMEPSVAWDTFGNLYLAYVSGSQSAIEIVVSTDGGVSFSPFSRVTGGSSFEQPTLATGPGQNGAGQALWLVNDGVVSNMEIRGAAVTGLGVANIGPLSAAQTLSGFGELGDIAIGPNGQVSVTGQTFSSIRVSTDVDGLGATTFSNPITVTATNVSTFELITGQPFEGIDAEAGLVYDRSGGTNNGRLYLVYTDELLNNSDDTEIYVRTSTDNGLTWSPRVRVNDDSTSNSQWMPKIALDQATGTVGVVWYDARNSLNNRQMQLFGSVSSDGGASWDTNTQISAGTSDATVFGALPNGLGRYLGLTFANGFMRPAWADNSNSTANNPAGSTASFDLYTSAVQVDSAPLGLTINRTSIVENADGNVPGSAGVTGTVRRPSGSQSTAAIVVTLTSDDTTEIRVPSTVTIPAGAAAATFPITIVDDTLLDGTQIAGIRATATISGIAVAGSASLQVLDKEDLTIQIDKNAIFENAGQNAATLTITRGNTDTSAPNVYAVVNNALREFTAGGTLISNRAIPWPTGTRPSGQNAHDLVVMENGRVAVYNGTTTAFLSIFNPSNRTWRHISVPGLSTETVTPGTGGISTVGNYVFLTDTRSTTGNPYGVVRVDTTTGALTRFADKSPGYRMFVKELFTDDIIEINPATGATLNRIPSPTTFTSRYGLAFDGTALWALSGSTLSNELYKLDPDTGAVLDIHVVAGSDSWDGLASLNGLIYGLDDFIGNTIVAYDPLQRRVVNTLDVGTLNNVDIGGGLAAINGPDRLLVTALFDDIVYEVNPSTGSITRQWRSGLSFAEGLATANNEIYVASSSSGLVGVYNRSGFFQRFVSVSGAQDIRALGGDNIQSLIPTNFRYRDLYSGLDDKLYVLDMAGSVVGRYDQTSLALEEFFTLSSPVNALAIDEDGTIWGAGNDGILYHFDSDGDLIAQQRIATAALIDIDLNVSGELLLSTVTGLTYQTNTLLTTSKSFRAGSLETFVSLDRHQTRPGGDLVVQLTNSDPTELTIPSQVLIPAGQSSVTVPIHAVDDNVRDGSHQVTITATAPGYSAVARKNLIVNDAEFVGVAIVANSISEAAGVGATTARVYRTDIDGPFSFVSSQSFSHNTPKTILDADKTTSTISVPKQTSQLTDVNVTLSLTHGFLGDLDIFLVSPSGTRIELVTDIVSNGTEMTATTFDDRARSSILDAAVPYTGSFLPEGNLLDLNGENPTGAWTLEITDDNGVDFGTLLSWQLEIQTFGLGALTVALNPTGDPDEIAAQQFVTIPANQSEVIIPVNAIDDNLLDGTRVAGLRPSTTAAGYLYQSDSVNVLDQETLTLTVNRNRVTENAGTGALTGTVTRLNTDTTASFTVALSSSDTSELTVPAFVTIPAGRSSATFPINAVDDNILDGTQSVRIIATAAAYGAPKSVTISVDDLEPSLLVSGATTWVRENAGVFAVTVTRQDQSSISSPMVVNLAVTNVSSGAAPFTVPSSVTIAANQVSTTFNVTVNDDTLLDGTQRATIRATSAGVIPGASVFAATDYETFSVTFNKSSIREDNGVNAAVGTVTRSNTNISSPLEVKLTSNDLSEVTVPVTVTIPAGARSANFAINAVNDSILDGTQTVRVTASAAGYYSAFGLLNVLDHEPPVVTAPAATTTNPLPVIRWNQIPNALRYDVLLVNLTTGVQQLYPDISGGSFTPPERLGIGRYRVTVRAIDQLERDGFWSNPRDFLINTAPVFTAPVPTGSVASSAFPEISWTAVVDAAGYQLTVNNLTTGRNGVISQTNLPTTSYRSTEGLGSGVYSATVRAFNSARELGLWSTTIQFTVLAAPSVVTPVIGGTFDRTPALTWTAVPGAVNYDVMLTNLATKEVQRDRYVTGLSYLVPRDLANSTYEVSVRAQNGSYFSAWSAPRIFSVGAPPTITTPGNSTTVGSRPKFVWTGISGTERYEVWVRNVDTGVYAFKVDNVTQTTYTAPNVLPLAKYRIYVRAISTLGEVTAWSKPVDFIAGAVANVTSPTANSTTVSRPIISWTSVTGAVGYVVQIRNLDTNTVALTTVPQTGNNYALTSALASGRYRVWVQAVSSAGYRSNWGASVDFFVTESAPKMSVPPNDGDDLLASVQSELTSPVAASSTKTVAGIQMTPSTSRTVAQAIENLPQSDPTEVPSAEHLIAAATGIEAIHDAVMSGWDASEWWTARS